MIDIYRLTQASQVEIGDRIQYQDDNDDLDESVDEEEFFLVEDLETNDGTVFFYDEDDQVMSVEEDSLVRMLIT